MISAIGSKQARLGCLARMVLGFSAFGTGTAMAEPTPLSTIVVTASPDDAMRADATLTNADLVAPRAFSSDTARLFENVPGVSTYSAGGISSLPVLRGLADERLRVQVDGMDLAAACPNHMNPALSYIDPSRVERIDVFAGITPVSVGGDSIGGAIQVKSAPPKFAAPDGGLRMEGQLGGFYRSNGDARGYNLRASLAGERLALAYTESGARSDNYEAAGPFKLPGVWQNFGARPVPADEVASSAYRGARNRALDLAAQQGDWLVELGVSEQALDYEGFPNQRMDMVSSVPDPADPTVPGNYLLTKGDPANVNRLINLRATGGFDWGQLEAQIFRQRVDHRMDMLEDRFFGMMMPMSSHATKLGGTIKAEVLLSDADTLRIGSEYQRYRLDDWWPPIGGPFPGAMCCDDFWNIRDGERDRIGVFAEWETRWSPAWLTQIGLRHDQVRSDAGEVQGYSNGSYLNDANRFNAADRDRTDRNWDWTLLARYMQTERLGYEFGLARKSRAPSLYERYPWSTFAMAAAMNNFVGDGNGYVGNPDLKPEVAHTASASVDWKAANPVEWGVKATLYATWVEDYIDARRCGPPVCNTPIYLTPTDKYVLLQYVNQSARLYGFDLSAHRRLGRLGGEWTVNALLNYVRGENLDTGDDLYHMMPLNAKLALVNRLGRWTTTAEVQGVAAKDHISQVRNEVRTPGYALFNLRSSVEWKQLRVDFEVENLFDTFYLQPLGGAYIGQGNAMSLNAIPWGMSLPGRGRSLNVAVNLTF
ncbi:TonB-dependent receptor [Betaproteobacteria bacterium SCN1]|nr:TonB-dependent receptor [Betaproteobacteria bacterium SCN1]